MKDYLVLFYILGGSILIVILFYLQNLLTRFSYKPSKEKIKEILNKVINGTITDAEWDEFLCVPIAYSKELDEIRNKCYDLEQGKFVCNEYNGFHFNEAGIKEIKKILLELEKTGTH